MLPKFKTIFFGLVLSFFTAQIFAQGAAGTFTLHIQTGSNATINSSGGTYSLDERAANLSSDVSLAIGWGFQDGSATPVQSNTNSTFTQLPSGGRFLLIRDSSNSFVYLALKQNNYLDYEETKKVYTITVQISNTPQGASQTAINVSSIITISVLDVDDAKPAKTAVWDTFLNNTLPAMTVYHGQGVTVTVSLGAWFDDADTADSALTLGVPTKPSWLTYHAASKELRASNVPATATPANSSVTLAVGGAVNNAASRADFGFTFKVTANALPVIRVHASPTFSIDENVAIGTAQNIGSRFLVSDAEFDIAVSAVSIKTQPSGDPFQIHSDGNLQIKATTGLNYETQAAITITISASDELDAEGLFTMTLNLVNDVNERPSVSIKGIGKMSPPNEQVVGASAVMTEFTLEFSDVDAGTLTPRILNYTDIFEFDLVSGKYELDFKANATLDYEEPPTLGVYQVLMDLQDDPFFFTLTANVTVTDVNENPQVAKTGHDVTVFLADYKFTVALTNFIWDPEIRTDAMNTIAYDIVELPSAFRGLALNTAGDGVEADIDTTNHARFVGKSFPATVATNITISGPPATTLNLTSTFNFKFVDNDAPSIVITQAQTYSLTEDVRVSTSTNVELGLGFSFTDSDQGIKINSKTATAGIIPIGINNDILAITASHTFTRPGHHLVTVAVQDLVNKKTEIVVTLSVADVNDNVTLAVPAPTVVHTIYTGRYINNGNTGLTVSIIDDDLANTNVDRAEAHELYVATSAISRTPAENFFVDRTDNVIKVRSGVNIHDSLAGTAIPLTLTVTDRAPSTDTVPTRYAASHTVNVTFVMGDPQPTAQKSGTQITILEGSPVSTTIINTGYRLLITDPPEIQINVTNNATTTVTIPSTISVNVDNDKFGFDLETTHLYLKASVTLDYETEADRLITVRVTIQDTSPIKMPSFMHRGDPTVVKFTISITDVNEVHTITRSGSQNEIDEGVFNSATNVGYTYSTTDPEGRVLVTTLVDDTNNFQLVSGTLQIKADTTLDYENNSHKLMTVSVQVKDDDHTINDVVTVSIENINDNEPQITKSGTQLMIDEGTYNSNQDTGFTFAATDADGDTLTYKKIHNNFTIINTTLFLKAPVTLDYETPAANRLFTLFITATDGTLESTSTVIVSIRNTDDTAPTMSRKGNQTILNEGTYTSDTDTGFSYSVTDPDSQTISLAVLSNNRFKISDDNKLQIKISSSFDFETTADKLITLTIRASDETGNRSTNLVTISISNVDEVFSFTRSGNSNLLENESQQANTGFTYNIIDPENDSVTLSYSDNRFVIANTSNPRALQIKAGNAFDYENEAHRNMRITLTITAKSTKFTRTSTVTISVANVYEAIAVDTSVLSSVEVRSNSVLSISLVQLVQTEFLSGGLSFALDGPPPSGWTGLSINGEVLTGIAPLVSEDTMVALKLIARQNISGNTSQAKFTISVKVMPNEYTEVSKVVLPAVLDAVLIQSAGAIAGRISGLAANDNYSQNNINRELVAALRANETMIESGKINIYQLFKDREFALGFHDGDYSNQNLSAWMRLDFTTIDNKVNNIEADGSVSGFSTGLDYRFVNGGILGIALNASSGDIDFVERVNNRESRGFYDLSILSFHPYMSYNYGDIDYWASLGLGSGDLKITEQSVQLTDDIGLFSTAFGFDTSLFELSGRYGGEVDLFGEFQLNQVSLEPTVSSRSDKEYDNLRLKSGVTYVHGIDIGLQNTLNTKLGMALVNHQTSGVIDANDWGYEIFSSLEFLTHDLPLKVEGDLSYLAIEKLKQFSGGFSIRYHHDGTRLGSLFELTPGYRSKDNTSILDLERIDDYNASEPRLLLGTRLGYGFGFTGGVLTPYGNYNIDKDSAEYGLGVRFEQADSLTWGLGFSDGGTKTNETKFEVQYKILD